MTLSKLGAFLLFVAMLSVPLAAPLWAQQQCIVVCGEPAVLTPEPVPVPEPVPEPLPPPEAPPPPAALPEAPPEATPTPPATPPEAQPVPPVTGHSLNCGDYPGALVCDTYHSAEDVLRAWTPSPDACSGRAVYDPSEDALRFAQAGNCVANAAGTVMYSMGQQVTDELWLRFRWKPSVEMLSMQQYRLPASKIFVIWHGSSSCTGDELATGVDGRENVAHFNVACGSRGIWAPAPDRGHDQWDLQPGGDTECAYRHPVDQQPSGRPCWVWLPEWTTITVHLDLNGDQHGGVPWIRVWAQRDGEAEMLIIDYALPVMRTASRIYFSPYQTSKNPAIAHPDLHVWLQDVLVTTEALR